VEPEVPCGSILTVPIPYGPVRTTPSLPVAHEGKRSPRYGTIFGVRAIDAVATCRLRSTGANRPAAVT
jgi:hypothetical protein